MSQSGADTSIIDQEMDAIIFYLTAFAYIDGDYDEREHDYIEQFINKLVTYRARLALRDADTTLRAEQTTRWTQHFQEVFNNIEHAIASHFTESVADGEDSREFVFAKLKLRCYELFRRVPAENQRKLLELADELMAADGEIHPAEAKFKDELEELLQGEVEYEDRVLAEATPGGITVETPTQRPTRVDNYDVFAAFEHHYAKDPEAFAKQAETDLALIDRTIAKFEEQRAAGRNKLMGITDVRQLAGTDPFLDGHVYSLQPEKGKDYELLVLGDLHGCYSCLKAALLQADFFAKVDAHHVDPSKPAMKLVLLGDYIDRGNFSYNGVLRTIMQLYLLAPEHVYILRGNHEYYVELNGRIYGGVKPAEAINALSGIAKEDVFKAYKRLFEAMPNTLLFGRTLFAHAGIPRDDTLAQKWLDLSSLNDPEIRFQMLWSDPSEAEYIPLDMQKANARFPFGKRQFKSFMARLGCNTMLRGHERIIEGARKIYSDQDAMLISLFSAGGRHNKDLPETSNYREVTPMAMTIRHCGDVTKMTPFVIDWEKYNKPEYNNFFKATTLSAIAPWSPRHVAAPQRCMTRSHSISMSADSASTASTDCRRAV